jgi:hypothetical protein
MPQVLSTLGCLVSKHPTPFALVHGLSFLHPSPNGHRNDNQHPKQKPHGAGVGVDQADNKKVFHIIFSNVIIKTPIPTAITNSLISAIAYWRLGQDRP